MYILLLIVHVIACFVLIVVVLLQAGRGGGFSDMMGGGQPQSLFGTQTNEFMTKATEVCAVLFIVTSLSLGILSTHRGKSLMETKARGRSFPQTINKEISVPNPQAAAPVSTPVADVPPPVPAAPATTSATVPASAAGGNAN